MINSKEINVFFHTYFDNYIRSIAWEDHILEPASEEDWIARLRECSIFQMEIYQENQTLLEKYIYTLRKSPSLLSDQGYDMLLALCRKLYYSDFTEPALLLAIVDLLVPHYIQKNDCESLLFLYLCGGYSTLEFSRTGDKQSAITSIDFYKKVISFRNNIDTFEFPLSREYIFVAYYNLLYIETAVGNLSLEEGYDLWQELKQLRSQEKFCRYDESNPRIPLIAQRALDGFLSLGNPINLDYNDTNPTMLRFLNHLARDYYETMLTPFTFAYDYPPSIVFHYYHILAEAGDITWEKAWRFVHDYYMYKTERLSEEPEPDLLTFYGNLPLNLIDFLNKTSYTEHYKRPYYKKYRNIIIHHLAKQPTQQEAYTNYSALQLICFHPLLLNTFSNIVEKTNFIIDVVVSKHLTTFTHSVMVSYLAEAVAKRIFLHKPEILYTATSGLSWDAFMDNQDQTMDFIVRSALLHDIGKNGLISIINTQHRKLTDFEFRAIRSHPVKGATYLASDPDFSIYQDITLGHHKSYDGKSGYPLEFDNVGSIYRPVIDLVHICDCLDAATDYLSRNYHHAKSFDMVMEELKAGSGTEYNPEMIDLIMEHEELYSELKFLTEENREAIYYDVYLTFVDKQK